jgi:DNA-binding NtrC family response regulator
VTEPDLQRRDGRDVLVVEDESRLRAMLLRAIRDMDFRPRGVETAEAALEALQGGHFDIVLSDLNLPGMQGMDLCGAIRAKWPDVQVLILTGYGDLDAARQAIRLDVVDFLTKPCALGDLEIAFDRALRRRLHHIVPRVIDGETGEALGLSEPEPDASTRSLHDLEREHIFATLQRNDGNRAAAAEELGISVRTLYYRLNEYRRRGFLLE